MITYPQIIMCIHFSFVATGEDVHFFIILANNYNVPGRRKDGTMSNV